jgi:stress-induced morphogen
MSIIAKAIYEKLSALKPLELIINDESHKHKHHQDFGGVQETHFSLKIVSQAFIDKSMVVRHQMVYKLLEQELKGPVHALALSTLTKDELL